MDEVKMCENKIIPATNLKLSATFQKNLFAEFFSLFSSWEIFYSIFMLGGEEIETFN